MSCCIRVLLLRSIHPTVISGQFHMNLTPIPFGLFSPSQAQTFDHTTCATTCMGLEGPSTVIRNLSFGHSGLEKQIKAPWVLRFFVSPRMVPSEVIAETAHLTSALRYIRLSSAFILSPPMYKASTFTFAEFGLHNYLFSKGYFLHSNPLARLVEQNSCQSNRN